MGDRRVIRFSSVERRTPFVSLLHKTPPRTVCPNFYLLAHANGCAFKPGCDYCYLASSLWYLNRPRVFTNVDGLLAEVKAWIARDDLPTTVLNTGNLSDSLCFEGARPLAAALVKLFREEAEARGRPHSLLLVTKGGRKEIGPLAAVPACRNVMVSFSVNNPDAASRHERGVPSVAERLAAARELSAAGWRIRMRIDPMISGFGYEAVAREVASVEPERVTLGCLRAEQGLMRRSSSRLFAALEPAADTDVRKAGPATDGSKPAADRDVRKAGPATDGSKPAADTDVRKVGPATDGSKPAADRDVRKAGGLARYPFAARLALYREALAGLGGGTSVGLCEETPEVWDALGLHPAEKSCNCGM